MYMNYRSLVEFVGAMTCFDLALLVQGFDEPREAIRVQLSRWMKAGSVIGLRRGMYTLPDAYRRAPLTQAMLANQLYRPSYLSGLWALGYYDLIPERVIWLTSVTPRVPRHFENPLGVFNYRSLKQEAFFGYLTVQYGQGEIVVAEPEKTLLDHWHLTPGEWTPARLTEMRYQHTDQVEVEKLRAYAKRFRSPRLWRAVGRWPTLAAEEEKGTVIL
jgi:predicted transcriptional regulator of viral defense system